MNKTERRHELQENDLAAYLEKANKRIEPYSKQILVGILLLLAVIVAYSFYNSEKDADNSLATMKLIQNTNVQDINPEVLGEINVDFIETSAGKLAELYRGLALVSEGNQQIYIKDSAEEARETLQAGIDCLKPVAENSADTLIKSRASLGIALANSVLGNNDDAIKAYEQVIAVNESEAMVENANNRIAYLSSAAGEDFAAWFKDADFTPTPNPDPSLPPGLEGLGLGNLGLPFMDKAEPDPSDEDEANPLKGEASPRDLDGGLELPGDADKPAPADADKPAPGDTDKPAPADADKPAPADADKPAPADADKPAPADTDKPAPADTDKPAKGEADENADSSTADDSAAEE